MSLTKILKELTKVSPEIRFIRQKKFDVYTQEEDSILSSAAFAGLKGNAGIRFLIPINPPSRFIERTAREISRRLLRGDNDVPTT